MNRAESDSVDPDRGGTLFNASQWRKLSAALPVLLMLLGQMAVAGDANPPSTPKGAVFSVDKYSIDGGAGHASGGSYAVNGTTGQSDADPLGPASGGVYSVTGGIWPSSPGSVLPDSLFADGYE